MPRFPHLTYVYESQTRPHNMTVINHTTAEPLAVPRSFQVPSITSAVSFDFRCAAPAPNLPTHTPQVPYIQQFASNHNFTTIYTANQAVPLPGIPRFVFPNLNGYPSQALSGTTPFQSPHDSTSPNAIPWPGPQSFQRSSTTSAISPMTFDFRSATLDPTISSAQWMPSVPLLQPNNNLASTSYATDLVLPPLEPERYVYLPPKVPRHIAEKLKMKPRFRNLPPDTTNVVYSEASPSAAAWIVEFETYSLSDIGEPVLTRSDFYVCNDPNVPACDYAGGSQGDLGRHLLCGPHVRGRKGRGLKCGDCPWTSECQRKDSLRRHQKKCLPYLARMEADMNMQNARKRRFSHDITNEAVAKKPRI